MKAYIASRQSQRGYVEKISEQLKKKEYELIFNWIELPDLRPYKDNENESRAISKKIVDSIKGSDLFLLISDSGGTDMFIELGIAISENSMKGSPKIYCIGEHNNRSLMLHHPSIKRINSIEEIV